MNNLLLNRICFLFILSVISSFGLKGQDTLLYENFSNFQNYSNYGGGLYSFAEEWESYNGDGLTHSENLAVFFFDEEAGFANVNFSDVGGVAISNSRYTPAGTADDWLVTPGIEISGEGYALSWRGFSFDATLTERYEVFVSTSNTLEDLQSLGDAERIFDTGVAGESLEPTQHHVILDDYIGQTVYIAFHDYSTNRFVLALDDIIIRYVPGVVDVQNVSSLADFPVDYGSIPLSQVTSMGPFTASCSNFSREPISDVNFTVHIDSLIDGIDFFYETINTGGENGADPTVLDFLEIFSASGVSDNIEFLDDFQITSDATWLPASSGVYKMYYTIDYVGDGDPENNRSDDYYFVVYEDEDSVASAFSRHLFEMALFDPVIKDEAAFYWFSNDTQDENDNIIDFANEAEFGITIETQTYVELTDIVALLLKPAGIIEARLYETFNGAFPNESDLIATTSIDFGPVSVETFAFETFTFDESINLSPGTYFVSIVNPSDGAATLFFTNNYAQDGFGYARLDDPVDMDDGDWFNLNTTFVPIIEAFVYEVDPPPFASNIDIEIEVEDYNIFNLSAIPDGEVESYVWTISNGNMVFGEDITAVFDEPGIYEACVTADIEDGSSIGPFCVDLVVVAADEVDIEFSVVGLEVEYTAIVNGFVFGFSWDFGDGNEGSGQTSSNTYDEAGIYNVCLDVVVGEDEIIQECIEVDLDVASEIEFEFEDNDLSFDFTAEANGFVDEFEWDFGDGSQANGIEVNYSFEEEGTYYVCLFANLATGTIIEYCDSVVVQCGLMAEIGEVFSNSASVSGSNGQEPYTYNWYDADGALITSTDVPELDGLEPGEIYSVEIADQGSCTRVLEFETVGCNLNLNPPLVDFTLSNRVTVGFPIDEIEENQLIEFDWNVPGETFSSSDGLIFDLEEGDYSVTVTDGLGCSQELEFTVPEFFNTGLEILDLFKAYSLYPNPAAERVNLLLDLTESRNLSYEIIGINGQVYQSADLDSAQRFELNIDLSEIPNGMYFMKLTIDNQHVSEKLLVNH